MNPSVSWEAVPCEWSALNLHGIIMSEEIKVDSTVLRPARSCNNNYAVSLSNSLVCLLSWSTAIT